MYLFICAFVYLCVCVFVNLCVYVFVCVFIFVWFCKVGGVRDAEKCNPCISDGWGETVGRDLGRESQTTEYSPPLMPVP